MKTLINKTLLFLFLFSAVNLSAQTVYITRTGAKYHTSGCQYLRKSAYVIDINEAISQGYTACSVCRPSRHRASVQPANVTNGQPKKSSSTNIQKVKSQQCDAITKQGARCKRMTTNLNGRCWQHQ
jgi:hypothetical protein